MIHNICAGMPLLAASIIGGADGFTTVAVYERSWIADIPVIIICTAIAFVLQIIIHEGGHMLFGLLSGYKFHSFRVFNLVIVKTKDGIRLKKFSLAGTLGQCLMRPPALTGDEKIPYFMYNIGGVLMNLITAAMCIAALSLWRGSFGVAALLAELAAMGIFLGLANGIPFSVKVMANDGRNIISVRKSKEAARGLWLQMEVAALISEGVRLKDMPDEWFKLPSEEGMKDHIAATIAVIECNRALDKMDFDKAKRIGTQIISDSAALGVHKALIAIDLMYCEMVSENRKDVVENYLTKDVEKIQKAMSKFLPVLRTQYARELLCNKDEKAAEAVLVKFEKAAKNHPYSIEIESEYELIEYARQRYEDAAQGDAEA